MKLLVAEDDPNLGTILNEYLKAKGFETRLCTDGEEAFKAFAQGDFDMCILDVMMPKKDGFAVASDIRKINKEVPILFLTAKSLQDDRIQGFKSGADDYVTKPFSMEELLLRIKAITRRTHGRVVKDNSPIGIGNFIFNSKYQSLKIGENEYKLTSKENDLLKLLAINQDDILERTYALKAIWEDDSYFNSRSMDVYITKLRKYLKEDPNVEIVNVHGKGFKLLVK